MSEKAPKRRAEDASIAFTLTAAAIGVAVVGASFVATWSPPLRDVGNALRWPGLALAAALATACAWRVRPAYTPLHAAVAAFVTLALISSLWSIDVSRTLGRGGVLVLLAVAAGLAGACAARFEQGHERLAAALVLAGGVVVAAGGVAVVLDSANAVQEANIVQPLRYRGIGENPNTLPLLCAVFFPLAIRGALVRGRMRWPSAAIALGSAATVIASGSRTSLAATFAGVLTMTLLAQKDRRRRLIVAASVLTLTVAGSAAAAAFLQTSEPEPGAPPPAVSPGTSDTEGNSIVERLVARPKTLLTAGGRTEAWEAAVGIGNDRPAFGHGYGSEYLLMDEYRRTVGYDDFSGVYAESSFLATYIDLGVVGAAVLAAIVLFALRPVLRRPADPRRSLLHAAFAGAVIAGIVQALLQSYLISPGSLAALAFWTSAFALASYPTREDSSVR